MATIDLVRNGSVAQTSSVSADTQAPLRASAAAQALDKLEGTTFKEVTVHPSVMLPIRGEPAGIRSLALEDFVDVSGKLPPGVLTANADGSITTPGGYTIYNDGNHQWRIKEPDGTQHRVWGDPHVDENNDGTTDWNFDTNASFILPDGTKIFCDTSKVGTYGGADITTSDALSIQYNDSLGTMDVANGGPGKVSLGALAYDKANADGAIFVLAQGHHFVDGATLGDLFDAGGNFVADVSRTDKGTISALANTTLQKALSARTPSQAAPFRM